MFVCEDIVVPFFLVEVFASCVYELCLGIRLMLREDKNVHGDTRAVEKVGRQAYDGFHEVALDKVLPYLLLHALAVEYSGEADDGCPSLGGKVVQTVENEGEVGFGIGCQYACRCIAFVVYQGGVFAAYLLDRVRRIGDNGIEGFFLPVLRVGQSIAQCDVELVLIDIVQEHVHSCQVVCGTVYFLTEEAFIDSVRFQILLRLKQQRTRTASRVVNLVDGALPMDS